MARTLVPASSHYYTVDSALGITDYPFCIMGWIKIHAYPTAGDAIIAGLFRVGGAAGDDADYVAIDTSGNIDATTTDNNNWVSASITGPDVDVWTPFIGQWTSITNRNIRIPGAVNGSATSRNPAGQTDFAVGAYLASQGGISTRLDADIAEICVLNHGLTDGEIDAFFAGFSPLAIWPTHQIIEYWNFFGHITNEPGLKGNTLTPNGTPAQSAHPESLYYPFPQQGIASGAGEVVVGDPEGSLVGGKLIRGGLLLHGVLGR